MNRNVMFCHFWRLDLPLDLTEKSDKCGILGNSQESLFNVDCVAKYAGLSNTITKTHQHPSHSMAWPGMHQCIRQLASQGNSCPRWDTPWKARINNEALANTQGTDIFIQTSYSSSVSQAASCGDRCFLFVLPSQ